MDHISTQAPVHVCAEHPEPEISSLPSEEGLDTVALSRGGREHGDGKPGMAIINEDYLSRYAKHRLYYRTMLRLEDALRLGQTIGMICLENPGGIVLDSMSMMVGNSVGKTCVYDKFMHDIRNTTAYLPPAKIYPIREDNTADWKKPVHKRQKVKPGKPSPLIAALTKQL
jgi:hypothetical protein